MKHVLTLSAMICLGLILVAGPLAAADEAAPAAPTDTKTLGSDTLVVLVSDTTFGPDSEDADVAARYYCANRGKVSSLVGKERPLEFRSQVMQQWSLLTYRCTSPANGG